MEKKQKRRLTSFITAMSVLVSTGVFWQLRGIGTAMTDETLAPDTNGQSADMSLLSSSLCETDEVWESTLPELTDELAENAALIAASQLGYTENTQNYIIGDDDCTHKNYSRYGAWFGNPYSDWNTMFTCFCLHYAGVTEADIPFSSGCWAWSLKLSAKGVLSPFNKGSPKRGDVLLFDTDLDGKADRSGIISEIISDTDNPCIITIEGQTDGAVAECSYQTDDEHIFGYVPVETPQTADETAMKFTAESVSGIKVSASAEQGIFPDGTKMLAADISRKEAIKQASDALGTETADIEAVAVDISFISPEGIELEPADSSVVHVEIDLPEEQKLSGSQYSLLHIADSGGAEIVENADVSESGAVFDADSFSIYVVTATGEEKEKDKTHESLDYIPWLVSSEGNAGFINNTWGTPYLVKKGDTITIAGYSKLPGKYFFYDKESEYNAILSQGAYDDSQNIAVVGNDGNTYYKKVRQYTAKSAGEVEIKMEFEDGRAISFFVRVMDNVTHYLDFSSIVDNHAKGYSADNPYVINRGDTVILSENLGNIYYYWDNGIGYHGYFYSIMPEEDQYKYRTDLFDGLNGSESNNKRTATMTAINKDNFRVQPVSLHMSNGSYKTIYFKVEEMADNTMTHADIEIDDGGTYLHTKKVIAPDGSYTETVTEYNAYVDQVNKCEIFNANNKVISEFNSSHYYRHGTPGVTQYELTSNYILCEDQNGNDGWKLPNGDRVLTRDDSATNFYLLDADTARFNVNLLLIPKTETVNRYDKNGVLISKGNPENISSRESLTLNNVIFNMDHQSVIDAHNKCPLHTGLDFTIKASLNEVLQETLPIYRLPSTGGSGVVPYIITGSAVIILSFAGLLLRKRKEDK